MGYSISIEGQPHIGDKKMKSAIGKVIGYFVNKFINAVLTLKKIVYNGKVRWVVFSSSDQHLKIGTEKESTLTRQIEKAPVLRTQAALAKASVSGEWRRFFTIKIVEVA